MTVDIRVGDVRQVLQFMPDESVHCVVTSPPYWGLRDYGTATWEGGDPNCDHRSPTMREGRNEDRTMLAGSKATNSGQLLVAARAGVCGVCGAVRVDKQIGLEPTFGEHLKVMVGEVFAEIWRVLRKDGTCWVNYGDSYATSPNGRSAAETKAAGNDDRTFRDKPFSTVGGVLKAKDLCMIPNRFAIAMQEWGWWVRSEIVWHKPNPMPESIKDRPATSHEKVWLFAKSERYWYDAAAVRRPRVQEEDVNGFRGGSYTAGTPGPRRVKGNVKRRGLTPRHEGHTNHTSLDDTPRGSANLRNVWTVATRGFKGAHFATFPPKLIEPCIKAGCPVGGTVLDPFGGAGTTGVVAKELGRNAILIELNKEYATMARQRIDAATRPNPFAA